MSTGIDKQALYGDFRDGQKMKQKLAFKAAHKALDLDDDMNVNVRKTGIGAMGAVGIALAAGIPAAGLGLAMLLNNNKPAVPVTTPTSSVAHPKEYDFIEETQQSDGTWKPTGKIARKRLNADGTIDVKQTDGSWRRES